MKTFPEGIPYFVSSCLCGKTILSKTSQLYLRNDVILSLKGVAVDVAKIL